MSVLILILFLLFVFCLIFYLGYIAGRTEEFKNCTYYKNIEIERLHKKVVNDAMEKIKKKNKGGLQIK